MPEVVEISQSSIEAIINSFKKAGLYVVSESVAKFGLDTAKKREKLMKQKSVSAFKCAKYELINDVTSLDTIKNMVKDKRFGVNETYKNEKGILFVTTMAIKRINGD